MTQQFQPGDRVQLIGDSGALGTISGPRENSVIYGWVYPVVWDEFEGFGPARVEYRKLALAKEECYS